MRIKQITLKLFWYFFKATLLPDIYVLIYFFLREKNKSKEFYLND